jgi:SAM-dependent methyltransferase
VTSDVSAYRDRDRIIADVEQYFGEKVREHGAVVAGVDWNGIEAQHTRFKALLNLVTDPSGEFSLLDYGCGYGAMYDYMKSPESRFRYTGYDISLDMIDAARTAHTDDDAEWTADEALLGRYDYVIASGIFNVRFGHDDFAWLEYIFDTLHRMDRYSMRGFAFNALTSFSDEAFRRADLYYANPMHLFEYCKQNFSRNVALLHDYDLYDFAVIVRK